jgi:macrolide transport system ATP-binding/permease protein
VGHQVVAVSVADLKFSYPLFGGHHLEIIKGISFSIEQGELVAIQGPSGSGKSTLLYVLGCLLTSFQGKVNVFGKDVTKMSDLERATLRNQSIGFVFQQFHLLPKATVRENILLPLNYPTEVQSPPMDENRLNDIAKDLGIESYLDRFPNQLSGGQQQRVAIARALMRDTQLILADEPTGSLDTQNAQKTMEILRKAQQDGKTVVIITHDPEIAQQCDRIIHFRDGIIVKDTHTTKATAAGVSTATAQTPPRAVIERKLSRFELMTKYLRTSLRVFPIALKSLLQNKSRTALTMLGIVIGVAAVLSMVTVGKYTKRKILDSYAELGVHTMLFYGWPNWDLKAVDRPPVMFQGFDTEKDLKPLLKIFPDLRAMSPLLFSWNISAAFGGVTTEEDIRLIGTTRDGFRLSNRVLMLGNNFSSFQIDNRSAVCILGFDVYERLFKTVEPIGQIIFINKGDRAFGCRVIGVAQPHNSNKEWNNPNQQIIVPHSFFQGISSTWEGQTRQVLLETREGADVQAVGLGIKAFFERRYGKSGMFNIGSDSVLIAQMNKFLNMFTVLLGMIALVSLAVGGIGITNMMLVSVSERLKEIGIRKAFGATNFSIRVQYLLEAVAICGVAGLIGIALGFVAYQGAIYGATKLIPTLQFEWLFDWQAIFLSLFSILAVGILSGLMPALKAEKLEVIEALRSE